ncbi:MAG: carbamoyltransferase HypF [Chitinophagaceae bacterium]|nr:carbamoyltransferase HypF [Chitinophagaceae bacterium]
MNTWHIHIGGLVQGVGFRPYVCRMAGTLGIKGCVSNGNDGIHILFNATGEQADAFYSKLVNSPPANAIIRIHHCERTHPKKFDDFSIQASDTTAKPDMLLAPDIAICHQCLHEIQDPVSNRFQYPFTTCLECGPRYSVISSLPYDRENTTMAELKMCACCDTEYNDINNRRHYSQTNSCPYCSIPVHLFDNQGTAICHDTECAMVLVHQALQEGKIVAVKGIGGYLLLCDATRQHSIRTLRERKHRPAKPFAVMYSSLAMMEKDLIITGKEREALTGKVSPIVLCKLKQEPATGLCTNAVAPGLDKIGAMLPYTALLFLIAKRFAHPLIATSGNLSGSPVIYTDEDALIWLGDQADLILAFDRDIVTPQDDSVLQFSERYEHRIVIRRSRGLAPNYFPSPFEIENNILAMGAELKSSFALLDDHNLYVSQYLGDQGSFDSQESYKDTLRHLSALLHFKPCQILIDSHPNYYVSTLGGDIGEKLKIPVSAVQHHKAHFCAVLAENDLLNEENVLGVIWDGTGYGDDQQIWGGEFLLLEDGDISRYMHLDYFPQLLGDKMSKEPRISAVSLLRKNMDHLMMIRDQFSIEEREFYLKLLDQPQHLLTSSVGRLLDGIASMLNIQSFNTYEGEAAMKLEAAARTCDNRSFDHYAIPVNKNRLDWSVMTDAIMIDRKDDIAVPVIARKVFVSLAMLIRNVAIRAGVKKIAFSGGVFQNALLVDLITELMQEEFELYFHKQLSPNDECIGFGQIAYVQLKEQKEKNNRHLAEAGGSLI